MNLPDPAPVLELIDAFRRSKTMFTAVAMGIFEALYRSPADAPALAAELHANAGAMERLLDACVGLGLLAKSGAVYRNQPVSETYLCDGSPQSMTGYIRYSDEALYPMWAHLDDAVREGSHRWTQTFGGRDTLFEHFYGTPERQRSFLRGMHGFGQLSSPAVVAAFDLSPFDHMVDLGGATGHLAIAACVRYPNLTAGVLELPGVIGITREFVLASTVASRIACIAGDFFRDVLPAAGLYSLGRVLHDWPEDRIRLLLSKIYHALPAGGALLIAEKLLDEDKSGPIPVHMQSLNMLVCTEGQERTLAEYTDLLRAAGFESIAGKRTGTPLDAILAVKVLNP